MSALQRSASDIRSGHVCGSAANLRRNHSAITLGGRSGADGKGTMGVSPLIARPATPTELKAKFKSLNDVEFKSKFRASNTKCRDGRLCFEEFTHMLRHGGTRLSRKEVNALFKSCDKSGNGFVNFDEFVDFIHTVPPTAEANGKAEINEFARRRLIVQRKTEEQLERKRRGEEQRKIECAVFGRRRRQEQCKLDEGLEGRCLAAVKGTLARKVRGTLEEQRKAEEAHNAEVELEENRLALTQRKAEEETEIERKRLEEHRKAEEEAEGMRAEADQRKVEDKAELMSVEEKEQRTLLAEAQQTFEKEKSELERKRIEDNCKDKEESERMRTEANWRKVKEEAEWMSVEEKEGKRLTKTQRSAENEEKKENLEVVRKGLEDDRKAEERLARMRTEADWRKVEDGAALMIAEEELSKEQEQNESEHKRLQEAPRADEEQERKLLAAELLQVFFQDFVGGTDCNGTDFGRLMKYCKLYDRRFTQNDAEIIFAKCVSVDTGKRRMGFKEFMTALKVVSAKKKVPQNQILELVKDASKSAPIKQYVAPLGDHPTATVSNKPLDPPALTAPTKDAVTVSETVPLSAQPPPPHLSLAVAASFKDSPDSMMLSYADTQGSRESLLPLPPAEVVPAEPSSLAAAPRSAQPNLVPPSALAHASPPRDASEAIAPPAQAVSSKVAPVAVALPDAQRAPLGTNTSPATPLSPMLSETSKKALRIRVESASGLRDADGFGFGKSDPYCTVEMKDARGVKKRTKVVNDTLDPVWNEELDLLDYDVGKSIIFKVWDKDPGESDDFLGHVTLISSLFLPNGSGDAPLELSLKYAGKKIKATLRVKISVL